MHLVGKEKSQEAHDRSDDTEGEGDCDNDIHDESNNDHGHGESLCFF